MIMEKLNLQDVWKIYILACPRPDLRVFSFKTNAFWIVQSAAAAESESQTAFGGKGQRFTLGAVIGGLHHIGKSDVAFCALHKW